MKVELKYGWFAPNAIFYPPGVQEVPDSFFDALPSSAKLADVKKEVEVKEKTLKDFDEDRANADATIELLTKFEKTKKGK